MTVEKFTKKRVKPLPSLTSFLTDNRSVRRTYSSYLDYCWERGLLASSTSVYRRMERTAP